MKAVFGRVALAGVLISLSTVISFAQDRPRTGVQTAASTPVVRDAEASMADIALANSGREDEIGTGDRLKVTFFGNADLSGEVRVQSDGRITLPALGSFAISGKTTAEIAAVISARFAQDARRATNNVVVEVVEWRPVFVTGGVSKPGAYAYMPGMTALHAVSMAGGFYRIGDGDVSTFVNVTQNVARVQEMREQLKQTLLRMASLKAERSGAEQIETPRQLSKLADEEQISGLLATEAKALATRREAFNSEQNVRHEQIEMIRQEVAGYRKQMAEVLESLEKKRQYLDDVTSQVAKGVSRRPDLVNQEAHVERLQAEHRNLISQIGRLEREQAKLEQETAALALQRKIRIDEEMVGLEQRMNATEAMLDGAISIVSQLGGESLLPKFGGGPQQNRSVMLLRKANDGKEVYVEALFTTRLRAGDVVVIGGGLNDANAAPEPMVSKGSDGLALTQRVQTHRGKALR